MTLAQNFSDLAIVSPYQVTPVFLASPHYFLNNHSFWHPQMFQAYLISGYHAGSLALGNHCLQALWHTCIGFCVSLGVCVYVYSWVCCAVFQSWVWTYTSKAQDLIKSLSFPICISSLWQWGNCFSLSTVVTMLHIV